MADMNAGRGTLQNAMNVRRRDGQRIGQVVNEWGYYRNGDFVIVQGQDNGTCTVEMPMSAESIAENKAKGSLIETFLTIINVPSTRVKIVL